MVIVTRHRSDAVQTAWHTGLQPGCISPRLHDPVTLERHVVFVSRRDCPGRSHRAESEIPETDGDAICLENHGEQTAGGNGNDIGIVRDGCLTVTIPAPGDGCPIAL